MFDGKFQMEREVLCWDLLELCNGFWNGWAEMSRWWEVKRGKPLDVMMWANSLLLASSE